MVKSLPERLPDLRFEPGHGMLIGALRTQDTELLDLLPSRGGRYSRNPLFDLVEMYPSEMEKKSLRVPIGRTSPPDPFSLGGRSLTTKLFSLLGLVHFGIVLEMLKLSM